MRSRNAWYYEAREPGAVFAGFEHRGFYMRVKASYTADTVTLKILESRNLSQSQDRIHKRALIYLEDLDGRVRRTLGNLAQQRLIQELL